MMGATLIAGAFLALHFLAAFYLPLSAWGVDMLAYYPVWIQGLYALLGGALLWPPYRRRWVACLAMLSGVCARWKHSARVLPWGLALGGLMVFVLLKSATALMGDGQLYLNELALATETGAYRLDRAPVIFWLLAQLHLLGQYQDHSALQSYQIYSYASGFLYLLLVWPAARLFARRASERGLIAAFLLTPGFLQIFCGYVETYALLLPGMLLYLMSGYCVLERRLPLWVSAAVFGLLLALHLSLISLAPSLAALAFLHGWRGQQRASGKATAAFKTLLSLVAMPLAFYAPMFVLGIDPVAYVTSLNANNLLPIWSEPDYQVHAYPFFSLVHLQDFLNLQLLVAPAPLMVLLLRGRSGRDAGSAFLLCAAVFPLLSTFLANPGIGTFRDWDVLSLPALPCSIWAARALAGRFRNDVELTDVGCLISTMAALHLLLWLGLNANTTAAEARFIRGLERNAMCHPGRAYGWEALGIHYRKSGRDELSLMAYQRAIEAHANFRYWASAGDQYTRLGRFSEAVHAYERALTDQPERAGIWTHLGEAYFQANRREESLKALRTAIALDPTYTRAYLGLCLAYNKLGRYREAVETGRQALLLDANLMVAHYELLRAYLHLGDRDSARRAYEVLVRIAPDRAREVAELFE